MVSLIIGLVLAALFGLMFWRDRRRLANGFVMVTAALFLLGGVAELFTAVLPWVSYAWLLLILLLPFAVVVLGVYLIRNGLTMRRLEGHSLGNAMSLLAGIAVFALPVLAVVLVWTLNPFAIGLAALLFFLSSYAGGVFVVFLAYAVAYARMRPRITPAAVVVLGSRIVHGTVPPLLQARLDKAVEIYLDTQPRPLMIPSGGQGRDESVAEGRAMGDYLVEHGVAPQDLLVEDRATTTRENLRFARELQLEAGREGPLMAVTNDYHVLRAALLTRKLGFEADVVGGRTARYYRPSAFLREFVAVLSEHRVLNTVACLPFLAISALFVLAGLNAGA